MSPALPTSSSAPALAPPSPFPRSASRRHQDSVGPATGHPYDPTLSPVELAPQYTLNSPGDVSTDPETDDGVEEFSQENMRPDTVDVIPRSTYDSSLDQTPKKHQVVEQSADQVKTASEMDLLLEDLTPTSSTRPVTVVSPPRAASDESEWLAGMDLTAEIESQHFGHDYAPRELTLPQNPWPQECWTESDLLAAYWLRNVVGGNGSRVRKVKAVVPLANANSGRDTIQRTAGRSPLRVM